jgi:hypothetical protein
MGKSMPASGKKTIERYLDQYGKPKPLPSRFGPIDPQAPFDPERFFTAMECLGCDPHVGYEIDNGGLSLIFKKMPPLKTALQKKRMRDLSAWEDAQDPKREKQFAYLNDMMTALKPHLSPGARYFEGAI